MSKKIFIFLISLSLFADQVAIVGTGYVGLIVGGVLANCGHKVICIDVDPVRINLLLDRKVPIFEPGLRQLLFDSAGIQPITFSTDFETMKGSAVVFFCVPTPSDEKGNCDSSYVLDAIQKTLQVDPSPTIFCVKSTVAPGTLSSLRKKIPKEIALVYNPEFMREGSALADILERNPIVLGGECPKALEVIASLYAPLREKTEEIELIRTNYETAEIIKYGWNGFSALRLTYFNELSRLCKDLSADVFTAIKAISLSEKLLPTKAIRPGCGYGGSCFPKDTLGLSRVFEEHGMANSLVHQTIQSNQSHIDTIIQNFVNLIEKNGIKKTVAILGLSFKANTDDIRQSPAIALIKQLQKRGISIRAYDRNAVEPMKKLFPNLSYFDSVDEAIDGADCVAVLTDSEEIKSYPLEKMASKIRGNVIFDPRNIFDPKEALSVGLELSNMGRTITIEKNI